MRAVKFMFGRIFHAPIAFGKENEIFDLMVSTAMKFMYTSES